jgi:heat shock protein beta
LRRSLGVSLSAKAQTEVKPAPPTAQELPVEGEGGGGVDDFLSFGDQMPDGSEFPEWSDLKKGMSEEAPVVEHDEL